MFRQSQRCVYSALVRLSFSRQSGISARLNGKSSEFLRRVSTSACRPAVNLKNNGACSPYKLHSDEVKKAAYTAIKPPHPCGEAKTLSQVKGYLDEKGLHCEYLEGSGVLNVSRCVMCGGTDVSALDRWARFHCRRCGVATHFAAFERSLDALLLNHSFDDVNRGIAAFADEYSGKESVATETFSKAAPLVSVMNKFAGLIKEFGLKKIRPTTLAAYGVRVLASDEQPAWLVYPFYRSGVTQPASLQLCRHPDECNVESTDFDKFGGIFGLKLAEATKGETTVVVCDRAADALAVCQSTGLSAIALPADYVNKYQSLAVSYLDGFEHVKLWFSERPAEAKDLARQLGVHRCSLVNNEEPALDWLNTTGEGQVKSLLGKAESLADTKFAGVPGLFDDLRDEISHHDSRKIGLSQWTRFSVLNEVFGGFRPGELTVLSGPTGRGKTTFIAEYALDLICTGNVRTVLCSFEMPHQQLLKWMLLQYAQIPLMRKEFHGEQELWLERFERLLYESCRVMKTDLFVGKSVRHISKDMEVEVLKSGIQHVVVDNLQYMAGMATVEGRGSAVPFNDKFDMQDAFVAALRRLASITQAHVSLIVHTRKEPGQLTIQSLSGTSRVAQEADNIMMIQVPSPTPVYSRFNLTKEEPLSHAYAQYLQVLKNRYGQKRFEADEIGMVFNPECNSYQLKWNKH